MGYYSNEELKRFNFNYLGTDVKISKKASIYDSSKMSIGDHSRIDDFCVVSGQINIGRNVHITPMCLVAGGELGIIFEDFTTLAYGVKVFTQSDDYSGITMTNSTVPFKYKKEFKKEIIIKKHSIVGTNSIIMPGVTLNEGTSIGAMSLVINDTLAWSIYVGSPAKKLRDRSKNLLELTKEYLISEKG